ncbi:MAG: molybdenum cofactor guanylyltransferase [Omnitrophica bacterium]|nr:molybdenum cofactor guanylyltransferase [Candidatus Omnitrophota bacterium]
MGEDKAFVLVSGKPLIEILVDKLSPIFTDLLIITNTPELYKKYGIRTQQDIIQNCGPLGGIYTGLVSSANKYNFIVACDMPFLNPALLMFMSDQIQGYDLVIPKRNGLLEPLCAVYAKTCIQPIKNELSQQNLKISNFLQQVKVKVISEEEIAKFDPEQLCFVNINTPRDYRKIKYARI